VLHRAATRVPFYRSHWEARRRCGDRSSWELLDNWPVLEKDQVRADPRAFVADDCDPRNMFHEQTSGTTGKPIDIWRSRTTVSTLHRLPTRAPAAGTGLPTTSAGRDWAAARDSRAPAAPALLGVERGDAPALPVLVSLAPDLIPHYLDALARYRIVYLASYPSSA